MARSAFSFLVCMSLLAVGCGSSDPTPEREQPRSAPATEAAQQPGAHGHHHGAPASASSHEPTGQPAQASHEHAHGSHEHEPARVLTITRDPVCSMDVPNARLSAEEAGARFLFCAQGCLTKFQKEPRRYSQAAFDARCSCKRDMPDCDCGHCQRRYEACGCGD